MLPEKMGDALKESAQDKRSRESVWAMSATWLWGEQGNIGRSYATPEDAARKRAYQALYNPNLMLDYYRVALSRLGIQVPSSTVLPTTPSTDDVAKAISAQEHINYFWWDAGVPKQWIKALPHLLTAGNVGFRVFWDTDEDKASLEAFPPEDLFYEAGIRDRDESLWIAMRKRVSRHQLKKTFPEHAAEIDEAAEERDENAGMFSRILGSNKKLKDRLDVYYVYSRDGSGDCGIFLNPDIWLAETTVPAGLTAIHHLGYTPMPGSPWSIGLIENLVGPQAAYNKGRKQQLDHIDLVNKPKVIIYRNSGVPAGAVNDKAGEKIPVKQQGLEPKYMVGPSWPAGAERSLDRTRGEMNDLAGMQNTSLGKKEGGATSGVAIRSLAAQDISKLQITEAHTEEVFESIFTDALILYKAHLTQEKSVRIFDVYGNAAWASLNGTNLMSTPEVRIDGGSMFVHRKKEREERIANLLQLQLIDPEDAKAEISFNVGRKAAMDKLQDLNEAREVLEVAKTGSIGTDPLTGEPLVTQITIYKFDPLDAYKEVFREFVRDSKSFYALPPDRQDVIMDILITVSNPGSPTGNSLLEQQVYPPVAKTDSMLEEVLAGSESDATRAGTVESQMEIQQRGDLAEALGGQGQMGTAPVQATPGDVAGIVPGME
jgi:hypothetical protein